MPRLAQMRGPSFAYEDPHHGRNLLSCTSWATPDVRYRYDAWVTKQLTDGLVECSSYALKDKPRYYCFPIGCFHHPRDWAADAFDHVPAAVLQDARSGRALLLFDQNQEGNADPKLWSWFYSSAAQHQIDPRQIIYMTSDHLAEKSHDSYCNLNGIDQQIHVLSTLFNLHAITDMLRKRDVVPCGYDQWLAAKDPSTKLYNCLNRVLHPHRLWLFLKLFAQDLIAQGLVSMDSFTDVPNLPDGSSLDDSLIRRAQGLLPLVVDKSDFTENHFNDLNPDIYLRSWFSVITETYVDDGQLLIGEKLFKPMLCASPFMVLGSRGTLARLRELGFRTFPELWDESYDSMDITCRIDAIVAQITNVSKISDLRSWFAQAEPALRHNHALAWQLYSDSSDYQRLVAIWQDFVA